MPVLSVLPTPSAETSAEVTDLRQRLRHTRQMCRLWVTTVSHALRPELAALFARQALVAFAACLRPQQVLSPPLRAPLGCLDDHARQLAETLGRDAASLPVLEGLHLVTSIYPALLPQEQRGAFGAFYTPPTLVRELLNRAEKQGVDWKTTRALDPAAGGGAFLLEAAVRMRQTMPHIQPALVLGQLQNRLLGLELDPHAASLAQGALEILLGDLLAVTGRVLPALVRICDSLEEPAKPDFDLVVGNPPYGRLTLTPEQRSRYARGLYGHANLYGVFTDIALRWAKPNGCIAYVTPTSFLAGNYFTALRTLLAKEAPPRSLGIVHARTGVFEDVQQETMLTVCQKMAGTFRVQVYYVDVVDELSVSVETNGTVALPADPGMPWIAPRIPAHSALVRGIETMATRLADWGYDVSTGPLVWNRHKEKLRSKKKGGGVHPLVWAESVTPDGRFLFRATKKNHEPYFKADEDDQWMVVQKSCVLVQRTTAKEQSRRLIAAELSQAFIKRHGGVVVENHLNMVWSKKRPKVSSAVVAALLNSKVVDDVFRCISGSVAVSAFELESLPLPTAADLVPLRKMVKAGRPRAVIEAECARLYGVTA